MTKKNGVKVWIINGIIAAIYIVLAAAVPAIATGAIQFRVSEGLNHLIVFSRKYIWGIFFGCLLFNLFFSTTLDVIYGGGQTLLALVIMIVVNRFVKSIKWRMVINTLLFTATMFLIALMLKQVAGLPFWPTYGTTALSELIIMTITAPIMYYVDKAVHFKAQVEQDRG